ncbi:MAG: helicase [Planctomycetota bacterium]
MPRLNSFKVGIDTGDQGPGTPPKFRFNGHEFELNDFSGSTAPGQACQGNFMPRSFVHAFTLIGPEKGTWNIQKVAIDFETDDGPLKVEIGPAELDAATELNLWYPKPPEAFAV